jgi:hypothetical protein
MAPGQVIHIATGGYYQVVSKPGTSQASIKNLGYAGNAAPGGVIATNNAVSPAGLQGPGSGFSETAGGDLKGTYPDPLIALANAKGALIVGDGTDCEALSPGGTNGYRLRVNSAAPLGVDWAAVDLSNSGGFTNVSGALAVENGGTGQITANAAFNALAPSTARGDIIIRNATVNARLPVGTIGTVLRSDGIDPGWGKIGVNHIDAQLGRATVDIYIAKHRTGAGVNGGASVDGVWTKRTLNDEAVNTLGVLASLSASQITLPGGTYRVRATSAMHGVDTHRVGLYSVTDADWLRDTHSGQEIAGLPSSAPSGAQSIATVDGRFSISAQTIIELRYRAATANPADGQGKETNWGIDEVYASVIFEREALTSGGSPPPSGDSLITEEGEPFITEEGDAMQAEE